MPRKRNLQLLNQRSTSSSCKCDLYTPKAKHNDITRDIKKYNFYGGIIKYMLMGADERKTQSGNKLLLVFQNYQKYSYLQFLHKPKYLLHLKLKVINVVKKESTPRLSTNSPEQQGHSQRATLRPIFLCFEWMGFYSQM